MVPQRLQLFMVLILVVALLAVVLARPVLSIMNPMPTGVNSLVSRYESRGGSDPTENTVFDALYGIYLGYPDDSQARQAVIFFSLPYVEKQNPIGDLLREYGVKRPCLVSEALIDILDTFTDPIEEDRARSIRLLIEQITSRADYIDPCASRNFKTILEELGV